MNWTAFLAVLGTGTGIVAALCVATWLAILADDVIGDGAGILVITALMIGVALMIFGILLDITRLP